MYFKTTSVGYIYHDQVSRIRMYLTNTSVKKRKDTTGNRKETTNLHENTGRRVCMYAYMRCVYFAITNNARGIFLR